MCATYGRSASVPSPTYVLIISALIGFAGIQGSRQWLRYIQKGDGAQNGLAHQIPRYEALARLVFSVILVVFAVLNGSVALIAVPPSWLYVAALALLGLTALACAVVIVLALVRRFRLRSGR